MTAMAGAVRRERHWETAFGKATGRSAIAALAGEIRARAGDQRPRGIHLVTNIRDHLRRRSRRRYPLELDCRAEQSQKARRSAPAAPITIRWSSRAAAGCSATARSTASSPPSGPIPRLIFSCRHSRARRSREPGIHFSRGPCAWIRGLARRTIPERRERGHRHEQSANRLPAAIDPAPRQGACGVAPADRGGMPGLMRRAEADEARVVSATVGVVGAYTGARPMVGTATAVGMRRDRLGLDRRQRVNDSG